MTYVLTRLVLHSKLWGIRPAEIELKIHGSWEDPGTFDFAQGMLCQRGVKVCGRKIPFKKGDKRDLRRDSDVGWVER